MKIVYFSEHGNSGIDVSFTRSTNIIHLGGWYDSFVGISPVSLKLKDFLKKIGVDKKSLIKIIKEYDNDSI